MIRNFAKELLTKHRTRYFVEVQNKFATKNVNKEELDQIVNQETVEVSNEEDLLREQEIDKKRNKSRLYESHRNILHDTMPYSEPKIDLHNSVKYQRKLYGKYGEKSGVFPGICWPTKQDLNDIREYERIAFPYTIQETIARVQQNRAETETKLKQRQDEIVKKMAKLEQWKKELKGRIAKKEAEAHAVKERKDRLIEEVRRHFGFTVDPRDERFKEMLEQKEKAERKAMKEARKKIREANLIAKLQEKSKEETVPVAENKSQTN